MKNTLYKDFLREIKNTKSRFISILLIVALGVGFFVGVKAASPSMEYSADKFFKSNNLMDYRIVSEFGIQEDDVEALKAIDGVEEVMPSYSTDLLVNSGNKNTVVRVHALPEAYGSSNQPINEVKVIEGRLPTKSGECVVEYNQKFPGSYKIGDTVKFLSPKEDTEIDEILNEDTYTVVGLIDTPQYISFDRGISLVGDGSILYYMMILPEDFAYERYTEVYLKSTASLDLNVSSFSQEYEDYIAKLQEKIDEVGQIRLEINKEDIISEATKKLNAEKAKIEKAKKEAWDKILDGEKQLNDAKDEITAKEKELADGEVSLANAAKEIEASKVKIAQAEQDLIAAREDYNNQIAAAEAQLAQSKKDYEAGVKQYNEEYAAFQIQKAEAQAQIDEGKAQLAQIAVLIDSLNQLYDNLSEYSSQPASPVIDEIVNNIKQNNDLTPEQIQELERIAQEMKSQIDSANVVVGDMLPTLGAEISSLQAQYDEANAQIVAAEQQLADAEAQFASAKAQLDNAKYQIDQGEAQLEYEKANGQAQLDQAAIDIENGKNQIAQAEVEYENSRKKIEDGKVQLAEAKIKVADSEKELKEAKEDFDLQFDIADEEIKRAEDEINSLQSGKWYTFTRNDNPGYTSFSEDAERIDGIASIFPLFFFIVAALVCLTTMTRMVEEERTQIGVLKALGYDNKSIIAKYFFYAFIAAIVGSITGAVFGLLFLPETIFNAYKAMYTLPDFYVNFSWITIIAAVIGALLCTCTVATIVARKELNVNPATLMRPKAPKQGKRILLEKIGFIWNHMSFLSKVTARNIFRYKARFIMTVLGVAGCTALILAAYGLKDSISVVVPKQYGEIFDYDMFMTCKYDGTISEKKNLISVLNKDNRIESNMLTKQSALDGTSDNSSDSVSVRIFVPEDSNKLSSYIKLRERESQKQIVFNKDSVIITEKLATLLNIGIGDSIKISDENSELSFKVTGITENYVYNYVYISPELYTKATGEEVKYNTIVAKLTDKGKANEGEIAEDWLKKSDILVVNFNSTAIDSFNDMIVSLNSVVLVMIICAAALAFVVLYNLTNINVAERIREIATIKVLGFSNSESANYVYRENMVLSIIGILVGLLMGVFLSGYIVTTIEMDIVMFGRKVNAISFLYAALFTLIFTLLVNLVMYKKLNSISMVESLKSVE